MPDLQMRCRSFDLELRHRWTIASRLGPGGGGGMNTFPVVFVELEDAEGVVGHGEAAPSTRYGETPERCLAWLGQIDPGRLSFQDLTASLAHLDRQTPPVQAARCAVETALLDGVSRRAGVPLHQHLGLGFTENRHLTSFSIGIDTPEAIRRKVAEAGEFPILKLKVGGEEDRRALEALREVAPTKTVRVDANEAWTDAKEALRHIEWLARDGHIEFVEQPMPAGVDPEQWRRLRASSPLPILADESYLGVEHLEQCREGFHGVNVKLMKTGGILRAKEALEAARQCGLKTMIGCMIESSVLISAGAHLAELADYLDLDGNLLVRNDPFAGVTTDRGVLSFAQASEPNGLRVQRRPAYSSSGSSMPTPSME